MSDESAAEPARYVAIITDGNGRWAQARGLPPIEGHRAGADVVKARLRDAAELGIRELTVYSFSTENWSRPAEEVTGLMRMFSERILGETPELNAEGVRMRFIGRRDGVSSALVEQMDWAEQETASNDRITLFVAFNYGGRAEILDAAERYTGGGEEAFRQLLYAPEMHDPDLVIRTSGEQRMSNYLLWQSAYSELVFRDELWPDFTRESFEASLAEFERRRRRFGGRQRRRRRRRGAPPPGPGGAPAGAVGGGVAAGAAGGRRPASGPVGRRGARVARDTGGGDLGRRIIVAIPAAAFALAIVIPGGIVFTLGMVALAVMCLHELF